MRRRHEALKWRRLLVVSAALSLPLLVLAMGAMLPPFMDMAGGWVGQSCAALVGGCRGGLLSPRSCSRKHVGGRGVAGPQPVRALRSCRQGPLLACVWGR